MGTEPHQGSGPRVNVFRVDLETIRGELEGSPSINVYELAFKEPIREDDPCIQALENIGYYDGGSRRLYTTRPIGDLPEPCRDSVSIGSHKAVTLKEVPVDGVRSIIKVYVRDKVLRGSRAVLEESDEVGGILDEVLKGLTSKGYRNVKRSRSVFRVGRWNARLTVDSNDVYVFWFNDELFVALNVGLDIDYNGNLWDHMAERSLDKLRSLVEHVRCRYILDIARGRPGTYVVANVIDRSSYEEKSPPMGYEELVKYPVVKAREEGLETRFERLMKKLVEEVDPNQPVLEATRAGKMGRRPVYIPAQYCIPVYDPRLAEKHEDRILAKLRELVNSGGYKGRLINAIARSLGYLSEATHLNIESIEGEKPLKVELVEVEYNGGKPSIINRSEREVSFTADVMKPLQLIRIVKKVEEGRSVKVEIPVPNYVPATLRELDELQLLVLVEDGLDPLSFEIMDVVVENVTRLYEIVREVYEPLKIKLPKLRVHRQPILFTHGDYSNVLKEVRKVTGGKLAFAFILGERPADDEEDYYRPLKKVLFKGNVISQNIDVRKYVSDGRVDKRILMPAISNMFYDMLGKLGVKYLTLSKSTDYDLIIGVDVGHGEVEGSRIVGSVVLFDKMGRLMNLVPVYGLGYPGRETARIGDLLEQIEYENYAELKGKRILVLRDGRLTKEEITQLADISRTKDCTIEVINVKKRTPFQQLSDSRVEWFVDIGDAYLLKTHMLKRDMLPRPIKIDKVKYVFAKGTVREERVSVDDLRLLRGLSHLNYSTIEGETGLRLPAPVHYADKLLDALRSGWEIERRYLRDGLLYFL
ncbi:Piwi domain-containing protein [Infirmifilum sp.]|uniref:Piwi domain-containing protein n=1 Tax=Infirmifilum sp. TaxID=2856575 RepID=UPI003D0C10DA